MGASDKLAVVVGGGITGSAQALLLAQIGYRVILVDAATTPDSKANAGAGAGHSLALRTVAMSCRSQQLLHSAGLWPVDAGCPIHRVLVNDKGRFGSVRFDRHDYSVAALGWVVRNQQLEGHLNRLTAEAPAIEVIRPATATVHRVNADQVEVVIEHDKRQREVTAQLLVAADGTHSAIRTRLGIETQVTDYEQHALVANVICQREHHHIAYERFTDTGPLALLPLDKNMMAVVCTLDSARIETFRQASNEQLLDELQQRFGGRLGRFQEIGPSALFPLSLVRAKMQVQGCAVLIGNASVTLHPVAGQGLNLALRDVFELAAQLNRHAVVNDALTSFTRARKPDQQFVVRQTDALARWFRRPVSGLQLPVSAARATSMLMLDTIPALRNRFGRRNAGLDIPLSAVNGGD